MLGTGRIDNLVHHSTNVYTQQLGSLVVHMIACLSIMEELYTALANQGEIGETIKSWDGLYIGGDTRWTKVIELVKDYLHCNQFYLCLDLAEMC